MKSTRTWATMLALTATATIWAQGGRDLIAKAMTLSQASAKVFGEGGKVTPRHPSPLSLSNFKLTGAWASHYPDVDTIGISYLGGKTRQVVIYLKPDRPVDTAIKELGVTHAVLGSPVRAGAPKRFMGKPLTPEMLATYPSIQLITGANVPGIKSIVVQMQTGHPTLITFAAK